MTSPTSTEYLIRLPDGRTEWFAPDAASLADGDWAPADAARYAAYLKHGPGCTIVYEIGGADHGKPVKRQTK
jgi:hypothetical protein